MPPQVLHRYIVLTAISRMGTVEELEAYARSVADGYRPPIHGNWPKDVKDLIRVSCLCFCCMYVYIHALENFVCNTVQDSEMQHSTVQCSTSAVQCSTSTDSTVKYSTLR